jgi:CPA2 family monovalent cation:H+ antiporter-2
LPPARSGSGAVAGALIAGLLIAETDYHAEVEVITAPLRGLALGIFLITVGMRLDLAELFAAWPQLLGATMAVLAVKAAVIFTCFAGGVAGPEPRSRPAC